MSNYVKRHYHTQVIDQYKIYYMTKFLYAMLGTKSNETHTVNKL